MWEDEDKVEEEDYKAKAENLAKKCEELEAKLAKKNEVDEDEEEEEGDEEDKKSKKAKNFINESTKLGKISNETNVKNYWEKQLVADFEGTKAIINSFKANVKGVDVTKTIIENSSSKVTPQSFIAKKLADIENQNKKNYNY